MATDSEQISHIRYTPSRGLPTRVKIENLTKGRDMSALRFPDAIIGTALEAQTPQRHWDLQ
jgi:hypothetical protein